MQKAKAAIAQQHKGTSSNLCCNTAKAKQSRRNPSNLLVCHHSGVPPQ
jgi:hypothetical protein